MTTTNSRLIPVAARMFFSLCAALCASAQTCPYPDNPNLTLVTNCGAANGERRCSCPERVRLLLQLAGPVREAAEVAHFEVRTTYSPMTVQYETIDGTATAGNRYTAVSGTLTFAAGEDKKYFDVPIKNDSVNNGTEEFYVRLFHPTNEVVFQDGTNEQVTTVTILDDDLPIVDWDPVAYTVGENAGAATLTLKRTGDPSQPVTVNYYVRDSNGNYVGTNRFATLAANETTKDVSISIPNDSVYTGSRDWHVYIAAVENGAYGPNGAATITILDDDFVPTLSIGDVVVTEGDSGTKSAMFSVKLSAPFPSAVDVSVTVESGSAQNGSDFSYASNKVSFPPGTTELTIPVTIHGDTEPEADETFSVVVTGTMPGMAGARAMGVILNDDAVPVPRIISLTPASGSTSGNTIVTITGENLRDTCDVTFGGAPARLAAPGTSTSLTLATSPHAPGNVDVTVSCVGQADTAPHAFAYLPPVPPRSRGVRH